MVSNGTMEQQQPTRRFLVTRSSESREGNSLEMWRLVQQHINRSNNELDELIAACVEPHFFFYVYFPYRFLRLFSYLLQSPSVWPSSFSQENKNKIKESWKRDLLSVRWLNCRWGKRLCVPRSDGRVLKKKKKKTRIRIIKGERGHRRETPKRDSF